jgi:hypothetical protein
MSVLTYKRFSRPQLLQRIGRPLLTQFLEKFQRELLEHNLAVPPPELADEAWLGSLARMLTAPEALPDGLAEALYAIDEMSSEQGQEQLEAALEHANLSLPGAEESTREDIALRVWLAAPALLARLHNQQRLRRLSAFEYFGSQIPAAERSAFDLAGPGALRPLELMLDAWFARHQRGWNTCRIELYPLPDRSTPETNALEHWFLIRHGDLFTRAPKVDEQKTEIIHFRPQRDDVVVYTAASDELRINCRTRGECDLYVRAFGAVLRGNEKYFSVRNTYTLEPLRSDGLDSLQTEGVPELDKVVLRQIEVASENGRHIVTHASEDLFGPAARAISGPIPHSALLRRASFDLHFAGCAKPRPLHIRPPNFLKLGRHCDVHVVHRLLSRRGFRR